MTPTDIKNQQEWEGIIEDFARDAKMTTCLMDSTGALVFCRSDRYPLCAAIRDNSDATTFICSQINTAMLAEIGRTLKPDVDICDVGLIRVAIPIVRDAALIGQVTACGLASKDEELDLFLATKYLGIAKDRLMELARSTPFGAEEEIGKLGERLFHELNPESP